MENCLVTKLKGTVDNDNLPKIGELIMNLAGNTNSGNILGLTAAGGKQLKVSCDAPVLSLTQGSSVGTTEVTIGSLGVTSIYCIDSNYHKIRISSKYDIERLHLFKYAGEIIDISYLNALVELKNWIDIPDQGTIKGIVPALVQTIDLMSGQTDVSLREGNRLQIFKQHSSQDIVKFKGDAVDFLEKATLLESLDLHGSNTGFIANIALAGALPNLVGLFGTNLQGSIESFVAAKRTAGVTNGSVTWSWPPTGVTFNGTQVVRNGNQPKALSWTASTITWDGTTINA